VNLLFPGSLGMKYRQGHSLYDRLPRPRALWKKAEELTGERLIAYSFGTPSGEMFPGPLASLTAFLHSIAAAEVLAKSGLHPGEVWGLGSGLLAAAVWDGVLGLEQGILAIHRGFDDANLKLEAPKYPLRWAS